MASAAARAVVTAVPTPPAVLVVTVVGLIAEGTPVAVMPVVPRLRHRRAGAGAGAGAAAERTGPAAEPRPERALPERPPEPAAAECTEGGLDRRDRVGGVGPVGT